MWTRRATDDAVGKIGVGAGLGGGWSIISWGSGDPWGTWAWAEFAQKKTWAWAEKGEITKEKALQNYTIFECKKVVLLFYRNSPFEAWVNWITTSVATLKIGRSYLCKDS